MADLDSNVRVVVEGGPGVFNGGGEEERAGIKMLEIK